MTRTQKRIVWVARIHLVAGVCALIAQIGIAAFLLTTVYWPLGAALIVCNTIIQSATFMASFSRHTGE